MKRLLLLAALVPSIALPSDSPYQPNSVLVVASPGYDWAAQDVSMVLGVRAYPVVMSLFNAADTAKSDPNIVGVVEIELNLDQFYENATAICRDSDGNERWREKRMLNFGGGKERLARTMVGALLKKVKGKKCPD